MMREKVGEKEDISQGKLGKKLEVKKISDKIGVKWEDIPYPYIERKTDKDGEKFGRRIKRLRLYFLYVYTEKYKSFHDQVSK